MTILFGPLLKKWVWCLCLFVLGMAVCGFPFSTLGRGTDKDEELAAEFFQRTNLVHFRIELGDEATILLSENPRRYVSGRVVVEDRVYEDVGVRLKGFGTFQPIGMRPSFALKFDWKHSGQKCFGLTKLLLNNSMQDPSRLCEWVASQAFREAKVPTPRITQVHLRLNEADLGAYVVGEAVNRSFLQRHFSDGSGALFEGEFQDLGSRMDQDNGEPNDRSELRKLVNAARLPDREERLRNIEALLDVEEFLNFLAVEMIVANWDGYAFNQNNYRVYLNPENGRFSFIPHGIDSSLSESGLPLIPPHRAVLVAALLDSPEANISFRNRVAKLLPVVFDKAKIEDWIRMAVVRLEQAVSTEVESLVQQQGKLMLQRIEERRRKIQAELNNERPPTPDFDTNGVAHLEGWIPKTDWNFAILEKLRVGNKQILQIQATNGYCFGSWRLPVWLPVGRYRIEAKVKTTAVAGLPSRTGSGAGVRVIGTWRGVGARGTFREWTPVQHQFQVSPNEGRVELIAELRAFRGKALFDADSIRLIRETNIEESRRR